MKRNLKLLIIFNIMFFFALQGSSQTNSDKARAAYFNASEAYNTQKYGDCVTELKSAIDYLGSTNVRIQSLLSKACFQQKNYSQAKIEIKSYFKFNPEVNDDYREILDISKQIDEIIAKRESGTFTDKRDGKTYKTIKIGNQTWMAENLACKADAGCWAYDNNPANVEKYGYLYNWEAANKACPAGWHLPADAEWKILTDYLGGTGLAGGKLKSNTPFIWGSKDIPCVQSTNESDFSGMPGGYYFDSKFENKFYYGYFWSSTESEIPGVARDIHLNYNDNSLTRFQDYKRLGASVRCIKN